MIRETPTPYDARMQRLADTLFWTFASLWLAAALAGGIAAAAIFPAALELPLSLTGYEAFIAADPEHGRQLVAGHLVEQVFALTGGMRSVLAPLTALALLAQLALAPRAAMQRTRLIAVALAALALLAGSFWSQPRFAEEVSVYRAAARTGSIEEAAAMKPALDAAHVRATRVASTEVVALLGLILVSAWTAGRSGAGGSASFRASSSRTTRRG